MQLKTLIIFHTPLWGLVIFSSQKSNFKDKSRNILDFVIFSAYELKT